MDQKTFISAIEQICEEKGISKDKILEAIDVALSAAYKKEYGRKGQSVKVEFDPETGKMKIYQIKLVVDQSMLKEEAESESEDEEKPEEERKEDEEAGGEKKIRFNSEKHLMVEEANQFLGQKNVFFEGKELSKLKKKKEFKPLDELLFPLEITHDFGRIAAQTAKQVITQRIREAERDVVYDDYKEKKGQVISGIVQRMERNNVFFDIGRTTGVLFPEEQIPRERYRLGQRMKLYILEVQNDSHGPNVVLSRAHPKLISQLFALEVPEISSGSVEIKSVAREPGLRSKVAVATSEERVDPIGSMIGQRGTRVQAVINELAGEKIDIIEWSDDLAKFVSNSLSPAKVLGVEIEKKKNIAKVTVSEDQLSLAIGIKGQNVRLAHKLTNCKIDIVAIKPDGKAVKADVDSEESEEKEDKPKKAKKKIVGKKDASGKKKKSLKKTESKTEK